MAHSANESADLLQQLYERRKNRTVPAGRSNTDVLPLDVAYGFATVFVVLGFAAIVLNAIILSILLRRHRYVFKHVFYLLIVNFTIIDTLKGACMILWATKTFAPAGGNLLILKLDQLTLLLLRFCNLATILNLLMITLNEFCFIVYPLRYRTLITKARAIALVIICWLLSWTFTVVTMLLGSNQQRIIVDKACLKQQENDAQVDAQVARRDVSSTVSERPSCFKRNQDSTMDAQFVFLFMIIAFCAGCLLVAVVCYAVLFRVISRIVKQDMQIFAEITQMQRNSTGDGRVSVSTDLSSGDPRRINKQLLRRHKYVLVIGSVIIIYMVYLISYSAIQMLQFDRLTNIRLSQRKTLIIRWTLQILVGLHSIFQPLCYFRMKEFRQIVLRSLGRPCSRRRSSMYTAAENGFLSASDYPTNHQRISQTAATAQSASNERVADVGGGGGKKKKSPLLLPNDKAVLTVGIQNTNTSPNKRFSSSDDFHECARKPLVVRTTDTLLYDVEEDDPHSEEYATEHIV